MEAIGSSSQAAQTGVSSDAAEAAVRLLLKYIGEDPDRDGLLNTPKRVAKALLEMTGGLRMDAAAVLATTFDVPYDELVLVTDIRFASLCEHHLLPFTGVAHVGYLPSHRVVGLSKVARLVDMYARRPQVQERMTQDIAAALAHHVKCRGVGVVVKATHQCMACRGVMKPEARMVTSCLLGVMREGHVRAEFLALCP